MENTGKVLFENDTVPQWYIALGDQRVGPLTAADVYQKVLSQEISWAHYVWRKGQENWQRICDTATFQVAVPQQPPKTLAKASKTKKTVKDPKIWFLNHKGTQYGPFATQEIERYITVGKVHGRVYIWRDGMKDWTRLEKMPEFEELLREAAAEKPKESRKEQRQAPRRPLVAKIVLANKDTVLVGVCRDISVGGMQVLAEKVPGAVGARIKMNVSPNLATKSGSPLKPFVAEGVIVRVLEDGRGFSFRFEKLTENAKKTIEAYIVASEN